MSQVSAVPVAGAPSVPTIPFGQLAPWALFFGLLGTLVVTGHHLRPANPDFAFLIRSEVLTSAHIHNPHFGIRHARPD